MKRVLVSLFLLLASVPLLAVNIALNGIVTLLLTVSRLNLRWAYGVCE